MAGAAYKAASGPAVASVGRVDAHQVVDLGDHAADRRRILEHAAAPHPVEAEALEGGALVLMAADRAGDLGDLQGLVGHHALSFTSAASPRRPSRSPTRLPRRAATLRGELLVTSAENAALIMLCGFEVPIDLATTSCTPSASKMARIGPPAMMPVPGLAARNTTRPAPKWPFTSWCSVRPSRSGTRTMPRLACSVALRMASGTSRALPAPWPTRPLPSPTMTRAAKPKRRPR